MGRGFHGDRVGREIEEGVLQQSWPSQSPLAEVFQLQTPKGPWAGPCKINNLLTHSLSPGAPTTAIRPGSRNSKAESKVKLKRQTDLN